MKKKMNVKSNSNRDFKTKYTKKRLLEKKRSGAGLDICEIIALNHYLDEEIIAMGSNYTSLENICTKYQISTSEFLTHAFSLGIPINTYFKGVPDELNAIGHYRDKTFRELYRSKISKYDILGRKYINRRVKEFNITLYQAYEGMWKFNKKNLFDPEGNVIWIKGHKPVYYLWLKSLKGCYKCNKLVMFNDSVMHHPNGYSFYHYDHVFSTAVISHKWCHQ